MLEEVGCQSKHISYWHTPRGQRSLDTLGECWFGANLVVPEHYPFHVVARELQSLYFPKETSEAFVSQLVHGKATKCTG